MTELHKQKCEACRVGAPTVSEQEEAALKPNVPEWEIIEDNGIKKLTRTFKFKNFQQALDFTNKVGAIAEEEGHHPVLVTEWGSVTVIWWSHKIKGLHVNDFVMAARTDRIESC